MYRIRNQDHNFGNVNFVFNLATYQIEHLDEAFMQLAGISGHLDLPRLKSLIHKEDWQLVEQTRQQLLQGAFLGLVKLRIVGKENLSWIGMTPILYRDKQQSLMLANLSVITDEVENLETMLKFANKKNSILQMLSHDLRGPLSIAKSVISILKKDDLKPESLEKTTLISHIIESTIGLIEDLVDKEFLETADAPLVKKRIDVVQKLREYIEQCKKFESINQRVFNLNASNQEILVELDESKFMQIINNLMTNSLKFTRPNGNISITVEDHIDHIRILFEDDGIGIPENLLPFIFDRYTLAKRSGLYGEPTTGLGLFIVKEIVGWHKGEISCSATPDKGTTFTLKFPRQSQ